MGGAIGLGNWSPAAEFNIYFDPEAAQIVTNSQIPMVYIPLEVTHTLLATESIMQDIKKMDFKFAHNIY